MLLALQYTDLFYVHILQSFVGHGDSINEIRTQALKPSLVLSASKVGC